MAWLNISSTDVRPLLCPADTVLQTHPASPKPLKLFLPISLTLSCPEYASASTAEHYSSVALAVRAGSKLVRVTHGDAGGWEQGLLMLT